MRVKKTQIDRWLLLSVLLLTVWGATIFFSASLGLIPKGFATFKSAIFSQYALGFGVGAVAMAIASKIPYRLWRKISWYFFGFAMILTALVFVPGIGVSAGGATRWISVFGISFQPSELLKIATVILVSSWLSIHHRKIKDYKFGLLPILAVLTAVSLLLLAQPDTGTLVITAAAILSLYFISGAPIKHLTFVGALGIAGILVLAMFRPYVLERFTTFLNPFADTQGSGYQITQSLIAIGSGGVFGRGFGQSVQKFQYLPEPTTDSIFAVYSEEFGLVGALFLLLLYLLFLGRGLYLASKAPDYFGSFLLFGLTFLIVFQAFFNMYALLGLAPLSGLPLPFVSQGGSSLATFLFSVGIMLSVSRKVKKS